MGLEEEMEIDWEAGLVPPCVRAKVREVGVTEMVTGGGGAVTFKVTGTVTEFAELVRVIVPLNVPAVRPVRLTVAVTLVGVVPLAGETDSQPLGVEAAVAVKASGLEAETESVCAGGLTPFCTPVNVNEVGLTESVGVGGGVPAGVSRKLLR
jgi:hypothetical protein